MDSSSSDEEFFDAPTVVEDGHVSETVSSDNNNDNNIQGTERKDISDRLNSSTSSGLGSHSSGTENVGSNSTEDLSCPEAGPSQPLPGPSSSSSSSHQQPEIKLPLHSSFSSKDFSLVSTPKPPPRRKKKSANAKSDKDDTKSLDASEVRHIGAGITSEDGLCEERSLSVQEHEVCLPFKLKTNRKKDVADFENIHMIQNIDYCHDAIWCMKWSPCGQLLAAAGQDQLVRVYCGHKAWKTFTYLRSKASGQQISPDSTKERSSSLNSRSNSLSSADHQVPIHLHSSHNSILGATQVSLRDSFSDDNSLSEEGPLLLFSAYKGHKADVLDISWSKNNFLLSSSRDKTVRLWHITRVECLRTFPHHDFVTTVTFHPQDDRYFLSGSLDGVLRLWDIPNSKLLRFNEVMAPSIQKGNESTVESTPTHGLITASAFVENGKFAVIGTYDGRIIFYTIDQLKYFTQINVCESKNKIMDISERKKKRHNNKVTGIENVAEKKILVTTNDSRIRLYDLREFSLACKYKGCVNSESQIRASVSPDNKYIVCGSKDSSFYIWRLREETKTGQRRDRNDQWESIRLSQPRKKNLSQQTSIPTASSSSQQTKNERVAVTAATFAPNPSFLDKDARYVIAIAELNGSIKLFSN
ncbi:WD repeat-containing protein 44 [Brevipalpus obovatus]|uniref:WD repeat-containing protein 44 n=1 Tax=Brevipalpus obovatus TaxID=246614 RepID=UPI003D9EA3B2